MSKIGRLTRRVTIQSKSLSENDFGEAVEAWSDVRTESASYTPQIGIEQRTQAQEQSHQAATFVFHSSTLTDSITPQSHRLSFKNDFWDITSNLEIGRGRYRSIVAVRRVS